jgi:hypothetical protein
MEVTGSNPDPKNEDFYDIPHPTQYLKLYHEKFLPVHSFHVLSNHSTP